MGGEVSDKVKRYAVIGLALFGALCVAGIVLHKFGGASAAADAA